jgi:hypothetical protein
MNMSNNTMKNVVNLSYFNNSSYENSQVIIGGGI